MRKFVIFGTIFFIIALLLFLTLPRISDHPMRYTMTSGLNNCRILHIAIQQFYLDQKASGVKPVLQPTISNLLKENYIDNKFFEKIQNGEGTYVIYFSDKPSPSDVMIQYYCTKGIAEINAKGDGHFYTWKTWEA